MEEIKFKSFDGTELVCHLWGDATEPKAVVQIIHGMSEHSLRYAPLAEFLNKHGYIVFADDHRAHGLTAGSPERVGKYNQKSNLYLDTVRDEIEISKFLKEKYPSLPLFIYGHSYGSLITQKYIQDCSLYSKAIICGTSYMNRPLNKFAKIVAGITKTFKGNDAPAKLIEKLSFKQYNKGLAPDEYWISHDKDVVAAYRADAFCSVPFSAKFYYDLMSASTKIYKKKDLSRIDKNKPLMLIAGLEDRFSNNGEMVKKLYKTYKNLGLNVSLKLYPSMRHEVHNEIGRDKVYADLLNFYNAD